VPGGEFDSSACPSDDDQPKKKSNKVDNTLKGAESPVGDSHAPKLAQGESPKRGTPVSSLNKRLFKQLEKRYVV
jgi:hypothetical protein